MTEVGVDLSYATAMVPVPSNATLDWKLVLTQPDPPDLALHAFLVPTEGGRWMIAIANHRATARLETWDAFLEASRSLTTPTVHNGSAAPSRSKAKWFVRSALGGGASPSRTAIRIRRRIP